MTLQNCLLILFMLVLALGVLFLATQYQRQEKLAVANGCAAFSPKTAAFAWVYRTPEPSIPSIPIEVLGAGQALGRSAK